MNNVIKRLIVLCMSFSLGFSVLAQEYQFGLNGGYAFADMENFDEPSRGVNINAFYTFFPKSKHWIMPLNVGYVRTKATVQGEDLIGNHWPIYIPVTFISGNSDQMVRPFMKAITGVLISDYQYNESINESLDTDSFGYYSGLGFGTLIRTDDKISLNLEYNISWSYNTWYSSDFLHSVILGIAIKNSE